MSSSISTFSATATASGFAYTSGGTLVTATSSASANSEKSYEDALSIAQGIADEIAQSVAENNANIVNESVDIVQVDINEVKGEIADVNVRVDVNTSDIGDLTGLVNQNTTAITGLQNPNTTLTYYFPTPSSVTNIPKPSDPSTYPTYANVITNFPNYTTQNTIFQGTDNVNCNVLCSVGDYIFTGWNYFGTNTNTFNSETIEIPYSYISCYNTKTKTYIQLPNPDSYPTAQVNAIVFDNNGTIYVGTDIITGNNYTLAALFPPYTGSWILTSENYTNQINSLTVDNTNQILYVGGKNNNGSGPYVLFYNLSGFSSVSTELPSYTNTYFPSEPTYTQNDYINSLICDSQGILYAGTDIANDNIYFYNIFLNPKWNTIVSNFNDGYSVTSLTYNSFGENSVLYILTNILTNGKGQNSKIYYCDLTKSSLSITEIQKYPSNFYTSASCFSNSINAKYSYLYVLYLYTSGTIPTLNLFIYNYLSPKPVYYTSIFDKFTFTGLGTPYTIIDSNNNLYTPTPYNVNNSGFIQIPNSPIQINGSIPLTPNTITSLSNPYLRQNTLFYNGKQWQCIL